MKWINNFLGEKSLMKKNFPLWVVLVSGLFFTSCQSILVDQKSTEAANATAAQAFLVAKAGTENAAQATRETSLTLTVEAASTADAQATIDAANLVATQQEAAIVAQKTAEAVAGATATMQAKLETEQAKHIANVTASVVAKTESAQPMYNLISKLKDEGVLENSTGVYSELDMFDQSWAQLGWFRFYDTYENPKDFVLRSSFNWDSASDKADPWFSGCGFVFRAKDTDHYYMIYLGLDGYVRLSRFKGGTSALLSEKYYGKVGFPMGNADFVLAVEGDGITALVNETKVLHTHDQAFATGGLYYTLVSGTNKGYGFHCKMTKVGLWEIK
jgi:hypothetical protein